MMLVPRHEPLAMGSDGELRLRLQWSAFHGQLHEVEYRVLLWSLSPEQRKQALTKRPFDLKGRSTLPPVVGTQTVVIGGAGTEPAIVDNIEDLEGLEEATPRKGKPGVARAIVEGGGVEAAGGAVAIQHGKDAPMIIAHLKPFEPPPRANAVRRTAKLSKDGEPASEVQSTRTMDVAVSVLPRGYGYVFAVEAKHSRGMAGNQGEWSAPLFSKLLQFFEAPRHLKLEVDARFGALLFQGAGVTKAQPTDERVPLKAPAVGFVDEHRDLPAKMGLLPAGDPWPLASLPDKYVVRVQGRSVYGDRLAFDGTGTADPELRPEPRPHADDFREP